MSEAICPGDTAEVFPLPPGSGPVRVQNQGTAQALVTVSPLPDPPMVDLIGSWVAPGAVLVFAAGAALVAQGRTRLVVERMETGNE